ncbi:MAG: DinB superfamily protein [Flavobacteriales bacterium]|nr:DinB superfamily protein [Flavobacteriales bacterium]|tara:strand:+ start:61 stop:504 length:444 start_codon:yes stop_codon:yes gene_type:complete
MKEELLFLYKRDLLQLKNEVEAFKDESNLWRLEGEIKNTAGNLALHLCGNLQHFIGHILCGSDYQRDRDYEFAAKNVAREDIIKEIDTTIETLERLVPKLDKSTFDQAFPIKIALGDFTIFQMLVHLQGHLNYHLGQVNYLRRILDC